MTKESPAHWKQKPYLSKRPSTMASTLDVCYLSSCMTSLLRIVYQSRCTLTTNYSNNAFDPLSKFRNDVYAWTSMRFSDFLKRRKCRHQVNLNERDTCRCFDETRCKLTEDTQTFNNDCDEKQSTHY